MKKIAAICVLILFTLSFAACSPSERTARGFSMGSEYYATYSSTGTFDAEIEGLLSSLESSYSARVDGSVISRINKAEAGDILLSQEESTLLARVFEIAEKTDYAFDPAILPLVKAWGFDPPFAMNDQMPPTEETIEAVKELCTSDAFYLEENSLTIHKTQSRAELDLGGAIKGYAADRVAELMRQKEVKESLVYIGGTIAAVGRSYEIGVTPPRDSEESYAFRFTLQDGEICATSGDYERFYLFEGKRYHHILDAKTGYPAFAGIISATVITMEGLLSDALSTACVVLGKEKAISLLQAFDAKAALVGEDKRVYTVGLTITMKDSSYVLG